MNIPDFTYHRPATLAEAAELGWTYGGDARYLAGGTEILVDLKEKRSSARHLISLARIPDLNRIHQAGGSLHIGAMTTLDSITRSQEVHQTFPVLADAVQKIGSLQIRNRATIGGNFCGAVPCADAPPVCVVGGARLTLTGLEGSRTIDAEAFFVAPRISVLEPGELLTEIVIPSQPDRSGASYQRFSLRHGSSLAVVSVAVRIILKEGRIGEARVALGAVAPVPLLAVACMEALKGEPAAEDVFRRASEIAATEAKPITDIRGSREYRRKLVAVLTFRALQEATLRAGKSAI